MGDFGLVFAKCIFYGYETLSKKNGFHLDRSQSDIYFVPQEIQTVTPLSMEFFWGIEFSQGRLITKPPKPTKQHITLDRH